MSALTRRAFLSAGAALALLRPSLARAGRPVVLVVQSDASERATTIATSFRDAMPDVTKIIYVLGPGADEAAMLADEIRDLSINLVFAHGDRAVRMLAREFPTTPLLYVDVEDASLTSGKKNMIEVEPRLDAADLAARLKLITRAQRVGLIRPKGRDGSYWAEARVAFKAGGLELVDKPISAAGELDLTLKTLLSSVDMLWIQPASFWSPGALSRTFNQARISKKPILTWSRNHVKTTTGAQLVATTSAKGLGVAGANAAHELLSSEGTVKAVTAPAYLVGNRAALRAVNVLVNKKSFAAVDEWVGKK